MVEQIIRPTGLVDPHDGAATRGQIDDLLEEIRKRVEVGERVLVTTLTKRMAEDLTEYLFQAGVSVRYIHSDIDAIGRMEVLRALRLQKVDVLVGINLLGRAWICPRCRWSRSSTRTRRGSSARRPP